MNSIDFKHTLSNGVKVPALGFGTFANEGAKGETHLAVVHALKTGYRHLDCAWFYKNEEEVGSGIREAMAADPNLKREDIFVCTKVWNHLHEPEDVEWSLKDSLKKLGLDYVDLFLIHWPIAAEKEDQYNAKIGPDGKYVIKKELTENPLPTWRAMEKLYKQGLTKSIGVSNFTILGIESLLAQAEIPPHVNQIEIHPFLPQQEMVDYLRTKNILPVAYSPLGSQDQVPGTGEKVNTNPELNAIAKNKGVTLAQVLIAWGIKRGYVVLPKSSNPGRIQSNAELITLTEAEFAAVNKVAEGRHSRFVNMKDTFGYDVWPIRSEL